MTPARERRTKARFYHQASITHEDLNSGIISSSRMFNFSQEGIYFESDLRLTPGEELFIGIDNSPFTLKPENYECYHAIIRWRRKLDQSFYPYGYGVKFMNPDQKNPVEAQAEGVHFEDIEAFADDPAELRKHPRYPYRKQIDFFAQNKRFIGTVRNIGKSGVFIETSSRFPVGQKLTLALPFINRKNGAMVKGEVMWSDATGIGVKFKKMKK